MNARHFMTAFATLSFIFAISVGTAVADDEANSDKPSVEKKVEIKVQVRADGNGNVEVDGNKIRITLPDGTTKTIDLSELAKGNIKGLEQFHKLGGDKVQIHGKAIIVGPDGKVREIEIDEKNVGHFRATLPKNAQGEKKIEIRVEVQGDNNGQTEANERKIRIRLPSPEQLKAQGDGDVKIRGKAIIVGPDGKVREIEIDEKNAGHFRATLPQNAKGEKKIEIKMKAQDLEELMKRIKSLESRVKQLEQK